VNTDTTREIPAPWLKPPVTRVYITPGARARRSPIAADLRAGVRRALAVLGVLGIAYFALLVGRGLVVAAVLLGLPW
jgi:hypothetical protein